MGVVESPVIVEHVGSVAVLTLNRPGKLNAIDAAMRRHLIEAAGTIDDDDGVRCVVIRGSGDRAFSAGADVSGFAAARSPVAARAARQELRFTDRIATIRKPTIAAIHGYCLGGGLELALACDIRIAGGDATFGLPEVGLGIIPGAGGTQRLPRLIGPGPTLRMILTGESIGVAEALRLGLVDEVVESALFERALELADRIAAAAPLAVRYAKEAILQGLQGSLEAGLRLEQDLASLLESTSDRQEGVTSFRERRRPVFRGR